MARIRTIKPEFWTSEQIVECSTTARLLFIGMWNFCDDGGNLTASLKGLKLRVLPADNLSLAKINGMVQELISSRLLREYSVNDCKYWHVTGWHHQKIEKPSLKYPQPLEEDSTTIRRPFDDETPADVSSLDVSSLEGKDHISAGAENHKRGTRIPPDFQVTEEHRAWATVKMMPDPDSLIDEFRDFWAAKAGQNGTKLDWDATFRTWMRNAKQRQKGNGYGKKTGLSYINKLIEESTAADVKLADQRRTSRSSEK